LGRSTDSAVHHPPRSCHRRRDGQVRRLALRALSLALGDNFYTTGVDSVDSPRFKATFEDVFSAESLKDPFKFYVVAGNHDHNGNVTAQIDYSSRSKRWTFPSEYYTWSEKVGSSTLQFVYIDTVILSGNSGTGLLGADGEEIELAGSELPGPMDQAKADAQLVWLDQTLAASTADFLIVAGHYPVHSICEHGPTSLLIDHVKPMLEQYKVTAYMNGHDHCAEYIDVGDGVQYHVIGSAHVNDPSTAHESTLKKGQLVWHTGSGDGGFASVAVNEQGLTVTHRDGDGNVLYVAPTAKPRGKGPPGPAPSPPPPPTPPPAPPGQTWDCHTGQDADSKKLKLKDKDETCCFTDVKDCTAKCLKTSDCIAVNWHTNDDHCHVLTGTTSHDDFMKALKGRDGGTACMLVKSSA